MPDFKDNVRVAISNTPGTAGALTVGAAVDASYAAFAAGDDGKRFHVTATQSAGTETFESVYTHSGTSLSRGTLLSSTGGARIDLTSAAIVTVVLASEALARLAIAQDAVTPGGRLTLVANAPVTVLDVVGATAIIYAVHVNNIIELWDGLDWKPVRFSNTSQSIGTTTSGREHSTFAFLNAGVLALEHAMWPQATVTFTASTDVVNWTSTPALDGDTFVFNGGTAPTGLLPDVPYIVRDKTTNSFKLTDGPGNAAINFTTDGSGTITGNLQSVSLQDGRLCRNGDKTRLLLGTFRTTSTTATEDSLQRRYLNNLYNQVSKRVFVSVAGEQTSGATANEIDGAGANSFPRIGVVATRPVTANIGGTVGASSATADLARYNLMMNGTTNFATYDIICQATSVRVVAYGAIPFAPGFSFTSWWHQMLSGTGPVTSSTSQQWGAWLC